MLKTFIITTCLLATPGWAAAQANPQPDPVPKAVFPDEGRQLDSVTVVGGNQ